MTPNDSESRSPLRWDHCAALPRPACSFPSRLFLPLLPFLSVTFPTQESQPQSVLSLGTLTPTAAALKASGLFLLCLLVTGPGQCRVPPATRGSLPPQHEALCQEHFLSGSDLLLLAAAEAGWGRGTQPGGVLVPVGVGGSRCIGASLVNLEIPGPVSSALPSHPLRLLSSPPAEGQTGGLQTDMLATVP